MSLAPFLAAPSVVQLHFLAVLIALVLGAWQLARPKGTPIHRLLGRVWMGVMVFASLSSFAIPATIVPLVGRFGIIHVLSLLILAFVARAIWCVRTGNIRGHRIWVKVIYFGGLIVPGVFAAIPGRLISEILGYG